MSRQFFEEKGTETIYIEQQVDDLVLQMGEVLYEIADAEDEAGVPERLDRLVQRAHELLNRLLQEEVSIGEYIYKYLFQKHSLQGEDFKSIRQEEYDELIKKEFIRHGMYQRWSLAGSGDYSKLRVRLNDTKRRAGREYAYLLAFGLGMNQEDYELMMKKVFRQPPLNSRSWRELIYYYGIISGKGIKKVDELVAFYENITEEQMEQVEEAMEQEALSTTETQLLIDTFTPFSSEEMLKEYLIQLRKKDLSSEKDSFERWTKSSRTWRDYLFNGVEKRVDALEKQGFIQERIEKLNQDKMLAYRQYPKEELLTKEQAEVLFADLNWTRDTLAKRSSGKMKVSRQDMLAAVFLEVMEAEGYAEGTREEVLPCYMDIWEQIDEKLEAMGMFPLYLRSPFDFFLIVCMLHERPLDYFYANWYLAFLDK